MGEALKVGDTIYLFDENHRVYKNGRGGPIYREHFRPELIVGETPRSWLVGRRQTKVSKKELRTASNGFGRSLYYTADGVEAQCWLKENRYPISRLLDRASYDQLQEIARILGYAPSPPEGGTT